MMAIQVDDAADCVAWQKQLPGVPIKTPDGEEPVLRLLEKCKGAFLPTSWKKEPILDEIERHRVSYCGISGFPEICQRNNEELFLAVARRIGYRFELREIAFPDVIVAGEQVSFSSEWVNVGVAGCSTPAFVTYSLLDGAGKVAWRNTDASFDLRSMLPMREGRAHPVRRVSVCRFGYDCPPPTAGDAMAAKAADLFHLDAHRPVPMLKPGSYTLAISVGRANGRPEIALPLENGTNRVYPIGNVTVIQHLRKNHLRLNPPVHPSTQEPARR